MNILKYAAAAAMMLLNTSLFADTTLGPSTIPANVTVVYPTPDTRVDLGPNASPLGLQQISAYFKKDVIVNPQCTGTAAIYAEGEETPLQTVDISGVSGDLMQNHMGSVLFPYRCTANGRYRVTIPEGFWLLEGEESEPSGAFDLYYEILVPQRIWPAEGVATELKEFRLEFPGYKEARLLDATKIEFFRHSSPDRYSITVTEGKNEDGSPADYLLITLNKPVTAQGDYSLFVKEKAAAGVNYTESGEEIVDNNIEALYHYTVSIIPAPEIIPAEGIVESFSPFELNVPEGSDFWFVNDRAISLIYPVKEDGTLAPDAAYRLTARHDEESGKIILTISDNGQPVTNVTPEPGDYALQLASGLFSGQWGSDFINSAPFVFYYQVIDTPDSVEPIPAHEGMPQGVYTIDGKRISKPADTESLPEGIYIIDGRKVIRK